MRTLQSELETEGFSVLAFPCNQFGAQEPGTNAEVLDFATSNYNVNFPMFEKIEVNGDSACDLYKTLKAAKADEEGNEDIPWNFTKFVVNREGEVIGRFAPQVTPEEIGTQLRDWL